MSKQYINIEQDSLYSTGYILYHSDDTEGELLRKPLAIEATEEDRYYTLKHEDSLEHIAYKFYKNYSTTPERLWWVIADANNIFNPLDLTEYVGTQLLIPDYFKIKLLIGR